MLLSFSVQQNTFYVDYTNGTTTLQKICMSKARALAKPSRLESSKTLFFLLSLPEFHLVYFAIWLTLNVFHSAKIQEKRTRKSDTKSDCESEGKFDEYLIFTVTLYDRFSG